MLQELEGVKNAYGLFKMELQSAVALLKSFEENRAQRVLDVLEVGEKKIEAQVVQFKFALQSSR